MKKLLALTIIAGTSIAIATGCSKGNVSTTGEAIGLVHTTSGGNVTKVGYLGLASVTVKSDKIVSVRISETVSKYTLDQGSVSETVTSMIGKDLTWAKEQLEIKNLTYKLYEYAFGKNICAVADTVSAANYFTSSYTFIAASDAGACTMAQGTWVATGSKLTLLKTTSTRISTTADAIDAADGTKTTAVETQVSKNDKPNSKGLSQTHADPYWTPGTGKQGWAWNIKGIEESFVGLTWDAIKDNKYEAKEEVSGATSTDRHQYAQVVKAAAKIAFGK